MDWKRRPETRKAMWPAAISRLRLIRPIFFAIHFFARSLGQWQLAGEGAYCAVQNPSTAGCLQVWGGVALFADLLQQGL